MGLRRRRQRFNAVHGVHQAVEVEVGIVSELVQNEANGLSSDQLIGEDDAIESVAATNLDLVHGRDRYRPRSIFELPLEKLRAHGRLAMGRHDGAG